MGKKTPLPRLEHIEEAATSIQSAVSGKAYEEIFGDRLLRAAVERWIEIVSEASRHVPAELKATRPEIPWHAIAAVGNVLRHEYDDIAPEAIWAIIEHGLPALKTAVAAMKADWLAKNPPTPPS